MIPSTPFGSAQGETLRTGPVIDALDRVNQLADCLESVSDLTIPETDLHIVSREKFAILLAFLLTEQRQALDSLEKALKGDPGVNLHAIL